MQLVMNLFLFAQLLQLLSTQFVCGQNPSEVDSLDYWKSFLNFQKRFNKIYSSKEELNQRFDIFKENLQTIIQHNLEKHNFTMAINRFTDLSATEFKKNIVGA